MMRPRLTRLCRLATSDPMRGMQSLARKGGVMPMAALAVAMLGGCVQVTAPDKPIVIELNVNIRQEVIYRLAADAGNTIEENEDIF